MEASKAIRLQGWGVAVLRVVTGSVFLTRGGNKLLVEGLSGIANEISGRVAHISGLEGILPLLAAIVLILVELVCGAALVLGLFTRWVCILLALAMLVNVLFVHPPPGFSTIDAAYESSLLRLTASIVLLLTGPGKMALDNIRGLPKKS